MIQNWPKRSDVFKIDLEASELMLFVMIVFSLVFTGIVYYSQSLGWQL